MRPLNESKEGGFFKEEGASKERKKISQVLLNMTANAKGEKDLKIEIAGLKITLKPHVLLMVYYFFVNSFPHYDETSIDKPSSYNFDPENAPKLQLRVDIEDSLICLQNKPGLKTVCCSGKIYFELFRDNIKARKERLSGLVHDLLFAREEDDDRRHAWSMSVLFSDLCPFVCSVSQLNS